MSRDAQATAAQKANNGAEELRNLTGSETPEAACAKLAQVLHVSRNEIALLRLEKGILRFIYPAQFHDAGAIPLTGSAIAARTAVTRTPLLSNTFARVKHASLFESMKVRAGEEAGEESDPMPIQKIISVPLVDSGEQVRGVIQISRKGLDPALAGADFTSDDLKLIEQAADIIANLAFMQPTSVMHEPK